MGKFLVLETCMFTENKQPPKLNHKEIDFFKKEEIYNLNNLKRWITRIEIFCNLKGAILVAQLVQNLPARWETWVRSLGWKDPLEKEMATHSSILAWKIPWTEEPGGLYSMR